MGTVALGLASLIGLSSCDEEEKAAEPAEKPAAAVAAPESAAAEEQTDAYAEAREALFRHAVYVLGQRVTSPEQFPEVNSEVKEMLALLNDYYAAMPTTPEIAEERARVALQIAQTVCDLGAYAKAYDAYEAAAKEVAALPEALRDAAEAKRSRSAIANGKGACLLAQGKAAEALAFYQEALDIDMGLFRELHPEDKAIEEGGEVPAALSAAVTSVLDSYRCLGDCQNVTGDMEKARESYKAGMNLVQTLRVLAPNMAIAYVKLLIAVSDLENELGDSRKALAGWQQAAELCQGLNQANASLKIKADTKNLHNSLIRPIMQMRARLAEEEKNKPAPEAAPEAAPAPAEEVAPAPVVVPEAETKPAAPTKPATNNNRRNRRNR